MSKYGVISSPYFPVFGLNTEIYGVWFFVLSLNTGKYGPEKTPYLGTFHAVKTAWSSSWKNTKKDLHLKTKFYSSYTWTLKVH